MALLPTLFTGAMGTRLRGYDVGEGIVGPGVAISVIAPKRQSRELLAFFVATYAFQYVEYSASTGALTMSAPLTGSSMTIAYSSALVVFCRHCQPV
jgi:hypothetical protein